MSSHHCYLHTSQGLTDILHMLIILLDMCGFAAVDLVPTSKKSVHGTGCSVEVMCVRKRTVCMVHGVI
jgi:hypothetical protein